MRGAAAVLAGGIGARADVRERDDFYPTPEWCTEALLDRVRFTSRHVWEPACGDGAICRVLERRGFLVTGSDLIDRGYGRGGVDFLGIAPQAAAGAEWPDIIITNPPFKHAAAFARRALDLAWERVALLVRFNWLATATAQPLINGPRCEMVISLGRASMLPPGAEDKGHRGMVDFAWVIWRIGRAEGRPVFISAYGGRP